MTASAASAARDVVTEEGVLRLLAAASPDDLELRKRWQMAQRAVKDHAFRPLYFATTEAPPLIADAQERGVDPVRVARGRLGGKTAARNADETAAKRRERRKRDMKAMSESLAAVTRPAAVDPVPSPDLPAALRLALDELVRLTEARRADLERLRSELADLPEEIDQLEIAANRVAQLVGEPAPFTRICPFRATALGKEALS